MAASISHEVRQPLGAILTNSETAISCLEQTLSQPWIAVEALNDIETDVNRAIEIFRSIGALFARGDQQLVPIDINEVAAEALRTTRDQIEELAIKRYVALSRNGRRSWGIGGSCRMLFLSISSRPQSKP